TRSRAYRLKEQQRLSKTYPVKGLEEHIPWEKDVLPSLTDVPPNIERICAYGFTEILNNVIDHSGGQSAQVDCWCNAESISFTIRDDGIGIFKKIKLALGLDDEF